MRCVRLDGQFRGCPRNCRRIADDQTNHWSTAWASGKVVEGDDPRARKPAASHESRANALGGVPRCRTSSRSICLKGRKQMTEATAVAVCLRRRRALLCNIFIFVLALRQGFRVLS